MHATLLTSLLGLLVTGLSEIGTETVTDSQGGTKEIPKAGPLYESLGVGAALQLFSFYFAWKYYQKYASDVKIEPVRHEAPPQKIWIHREGTIGIVSTKGELGTTLTT